MKQAAWISMVEDEEADDQLKQIFDVARTPHGTLDNVMRIHSLRPASMIGHVRFTRASSTVMKSPYHFGF